MIVMIFIITGYSFIGKSHDWAALDTIAHTIKPATSNSMVFMSLINYSLCAMTAVSMAFILGVLLFVLVLQKKVALVVAY